MNFNGIEIGMPIWIKAEESTLRNTSSSFTQRNSKGDVDLEKLWFTPES